MTRKEGKVKFYNKKEEYGYIKVKDMRDVRFDKNSFYGKPPSKGDQVEFEVKEWRSPYAENLKIINRHKPKSPKKEPQLFLPKDTSKIIRNREPDNFLLQLTKTSFNSKRKFRLFEKYKNEIKFEVKPNYSNIKFQEIIKRQKENIKRTRMKTKEVKMKTTWKMVIGLGNESVFETSMTLHHIYGIPFVPASALKGITRSYIIKEVFGERNGETELANAEKKALNNQTFCDIFGCPKESYYKKEMKGRIIFFDALPNNKPTIETDVMTPHYQEYYSDKDGRIPPVDYLNPIPIPFLIVKETEFQFIIGVLDDKENIELGDFKGGLLELSFYWMKKALEEHGIGAKTAVGYGYLNA